MSVNVQYLHGLVMDIVMIKPTPLNAIMMVEIAVALVLMISIVLNAHVIIATSQFQVNQLFILLLFCYNYTKRFIFLIWTSIMKASYLWMFQIGCFGPTTFYQTLWFGRQWTYYIIIVLLFVISYLPIKLIDVSFFLFQTFFWKMLPLTLKWPFVPVMKNYKMELTKDLMEFWVYKSSPVKSVR